MWPRLVPLCLALAAAIMAVGLGLYVATCASKVPMTPAVCVLVDANLALLPKTLHAFEARALKSTDPPWSMFHGLLACGKDFAIQDVEGGNSRSCVEWLLAEASWRDGFKGTPLVAKRHFGYMFTGGPTPFISMEFEDHFCQFLWILSECDLDPDKTMIRVPPDGTPVPVRVLVRDAQRFCHDLSDVSWALPLFLRWGNGGPWTNRFGAELDVDRLLAQHLRREKECGACFGAHWRMGLAEAVRCADGGFSDRVRAQAESRLSEAIREARNSMDDAGWFRLEWGIYPPRPVPAGNLPPLPNDRAARLSHQGHMLAWVMVALPDSEVATQVWPHQAARRLVEELERSTESVAYGAHSHCIHALRLYERRVRLLGVTGGTSS